MSPFIVLSRANNRPATHVNILAVAFLTAVGKGANVHFAGGTVISVEESVEEILDAVAAVSAGKPQPPRRQPEPPPAPAPESDDEDEGNDGTDVDDENEDDHAEDDENKPRSDEKPDQADAPAPAAGGPAGRNRGRRS